jgi:hypothetical protein
MLNRISLIKYPRVALSFGVICASLATAGTVAAQQAPENKAATDKMSAAGDTATEKAIPAPTIDTNADGKMDAWDRDANGTPDAWDVNGDGQPDQVDDNGDGKPDGQVPAAPASDPAPDAPQR